MTVKTITLHRKSDYPEYREFDAEVDPKWTKGTEHFLIYRVPGSKPRMFAIYHRPSEMDWTRTITSLRGAKALLARILTDFPGCDFTKPQDAETNNFTKAVWHGCRERFGKSLRQWMDDIVAEAEKPAAKEPAEKASAA